MKKLYIILFTLAFTLPIRAQHLIVEKSANAQDIVNIDELRKITFNGTTVTITQKNGNTIENEMENIDRVYFGVPSSIATVDFHSAELLRFISTDEIAINCVAGETINIYNINGSLIMSLHQNADGGSISIAQLPKGVYLLRVGQHTAKFIKR